MISNTLFDVTTIKNLTPFQKSRGKTMDPLLRGVCEQYIDSMLEEGRIERIKNLVISLDLPAKEQIDTALGFFLGNIYSKIDDHYIKMNNRLPNDAELTDYHHILQRRSKEISDIFIESYEYSDKTPRVKKRKVKRKKGEEPENSIDPDEEELEELRRSLSNGRMPETILGIPTSN